jgi:hypothetical protein
LDGVSKRLRNNIGIVRQHANNVRKVGDRSDETQNLTRFAWFQPILIIDEHHDTAGELCQCGGDKLGF